jgi:uncharacterized membrane protein YkgB
METITNTETLQFANANVKSKKIEIYIFRPFKAGLIGFATILSLISFINLLSYLTTATETFAMDYIDILLAGVGFLLQMTGTLLKSLGR